MRTTVHRPAHSLDTTATLCEACEGYWPCDLAGHKGNFGYSAIHDEEFWWCAVDCPHPHHDGRNRDAG